MQDNKSNKEIIENLVAINQLGEFLQKTKDNQDAKKTYSKDVNKIKELLKKEEK